MEEVEVDGNMGLWVLLVFGALCDSRALAVAILNRICSRPAPAAVACCWTEHVHEVPLHNATAGMILTTAAMSSALLAHETALGLFFKEVVDDRPEAPSTGAGGAYRAGAVGGAAARAAAAAAAAGPREGAPSLNSWAPRQAQYAAGVAKHE